MPLECREIYSKLLLLAEVVVKVAVVVELPVFEMEITISGRHPSGVEEETNGELIWEVNTSIRTKVPCLKRFGERWSGVNLAVVFRSSKF